MSPPPAIQIDLASTVPAYRQIADGARALLVGGQLQPGEQLPTVRQLAVDLGVHHNTVAEAYRTLAQEGWLDLTRRRGATVLDRSTPLVTPEAEKRFVDRLRALIAEARAAGVSGEVIVTELKQLARQS
jgi:GntR family transcriptional regulator